MGDSLGLKIAFEVTQARAVSWSQQVLLTPR